MNSDIKDYAHSHTTPEPELIRELITYSDQNLKYIEMLSGRVVGRLLNMLVKVSGANRVLEIGMFTGYSALMMADALPEDGELTTCDMNEKYANIARRFFEQSENGHKITLKMGEALKTIKTLEGPFDFIFIDADKGNYPNYYRETLPLLKTGGLMVIDNVFLAENVIDPQDEKARAVDELNNLIAGDDNVEQVMLTVRDGLTIVRKK